MKRVALYPGSFDPFTVGHQSIVDRALTLFDEVVIAVGYNEHKQGYLPVDERLARIRAVYADEPRVRVEKYTGLTCRYAADVGASCLLRGVRTVADYESERTLADVNREISGLETLLLFAEPRFAAVSSSMVRELAHNDYDINKFLPQVK